MAGAGFPIWPASSGSGRERTLYPRINVSKYDRRNDQTTRACGLALIDDLVAIFVNVPINNRLATWDPAALPPHYQDHLRRWWEWHHVRLVAMFTAMYLVFAAMLVRE
jgi:hypothetical protein